MRVTRSVLTAALFGLAAGGVLAAGAARGDAQGDLTAVPLSSQADCDVGGEPTQPYEDHPPEGFLRYGTRPVVIGCAALPTGRRFELVGYQLGRGERTELCIDHYDFETGVTWGCGSNMVRGGGAIDATSKEHTRGQVPVVAGTVTGSVSRVVVRSEVDRALRRHASALVRVRDAELLRAIGVREPFGRYLAEVPAGARGATAEARGARGRTLGLAFFPGFRGPVGEGRACYSSPRVVRLRLLDPARVGRKSRLRIVASYPAGVIGSVGVSVSGGLSLHADLAPRTGGHYVVTLPVTFRRRGFAGIDVTAEGIPRSTRCGTRVVLRRSALKTLAVRVR
jgi:hypothetical protein